MADMNNPMALASMNLEEINPQYRGVGYQTGAGDFTQNEFTGQWEPDLSGLGGGGFDWMQGLKGFGMGMSGLTSLASILNAREQLDLQKKQYGLMKEKLYSDDKRATQEANRRSRMGASLAGQLSGKSYGSPELAQHVKQNAVRFDPLKKV